MIAKCNGCTNKSESCGLFQEASISERMNKGREVPRSFKDYRVFTECKTKDPKQCDGVCTACGTRKTFQSNEVIS